MPTRLYRQSAVYDEQPSPHLRSACEYISSERSGEASSGELVGSLSESSQPTKTPSWRSTSKAASHRPLLHTDSYPEQYPSRPTQAALSRTEFAAFRSRSRAASGGICSLLTATLVERMNPRESMHQSDDGQVLLIEKRRCTLQRKGVAGRAGAEIRFSPGGNGVRDLTSSTTGHVHRQMYQRHCELGACLLVYSTFENTALRSKDLQKRCLLRRAEMSTTGNPDRLSASRIRTPRYLLTQPLPS